MSCPPRGCDLCAPSAHQLPNICVRWMNATAGSPHHKYQGMGIHVLLCLCAQQRKQAGSGRSGQAHQPLWPKGAHTVTQVQPAGVLAVGNAIAERAILLSLLHTGFAVAPACMWTQVSADYILVCESALQRRQSGAPVRRAGTLTTNVVQLKTLTWSMSVPMTHN